VTVAAKPLQGAKILVVEDDAILARDMMVILLGAKITAKETTKPHLSPADEKVLPRSLKATTR
jgi:hypothetical protein